MLQFLVVIYALIGVYSIIFYIRDMKPDTHVGVMLIALFFPPVFWFMRALISEGMKR